MSHDEAVLGDNAAESRSTYVNLWGGAINEAWLENIWRNMPKSTESVVLSL